MSGPLLGIHHVTALAKDPSENLAFYKETLQLRLVKKTVNFDDPLTYHLYFADEIGTPGTVLTHFPHPHAKRGVPGAPEIDRTVLGVAHGAIEAWLARLRAHRVNIARHTTFGETHHHFDDPHGMRFTLVESQHAPAESFRILGAEVVVRHTEAIGAFLTDILGFVPGNHDETRQRFNLDGAHEYIDVLRDQTGDRSVMGAGTVHHVAWRVPDRETQDDVAQRIRKAGVEVTPVQDRDYFQSIYCRIPGGVIFEIATDGPGFDVDEPAHALGARLCLPDQHEPRRAEIEAHLVPL